MTIESPKHPNPSAPPFGTLNTGDIFQWISGAPPFIVATTSKYHSQFAKVNGEAINTKDDNGHHKPKPEPKGKGKGILCAELSPQKLQYR